MIRRKATITDARGRRFTLIDTGLFITRPSLRGTLSPEGAEAIRRAARGTIGRRHLIVCCVLVGLISVPLAIVVSYMVFGRGLWMAATVGIAMGMIVWYAFTVLSSLRRELAQRVARAITQQGLCPACGYCMLGLEPEPDGATVCPECAAAWRA